MRKTFDAELQELNYEMIDMAAAAEDAIDVVTESLASGDDAAAKSACGDDPQHGPDGAGH